MLIRRVACAFVVGVHAALAQVDHALWMQQLMPVIGNATLLDLSLVGWWGPLPCRETV